jgi:hypothetical protein
MLCVTGGVLVPLVTAAGLLLLYLRIFALTRQIARPMTRGALLFI